MNEKVLGHFLRYKRTTVDIQSYPVNQTRKRRTPGLTRDEVSFMANVSVDWYTRIEQGRTGSIPSADVLRDLCKTLRLSTSETEYAFNLAGLAVPLTIDSAVDSNTIDIMNAQLPNPAFIMNQQLTILTANTSYVNLFGFKSSQTPLTRNWVWRTFHSDALRTNLSDWANYAHYVTAIFRKIYSLESGSDFLFKVFYSVKDIKEFKTPWSTLTIGSFATQHLLLNTSKWGELYLVENILQIPATNQLLMLTTAGDVITAQKLTQLQ